jgi:hypothetical protein
VAGRKIAPTGHDDQIGRIFAQWVIAFWGQSFNNYRNSPHTWPTLGTYSMVKVMHYFLQKMYWATLWAIFSQAHI